MLLKFDVFGKAMSVKRIDNEWHLFIDSNTGLRTRVYDVVIPSELSEHELARYLGDIFHESARDDKTDVTRLN
ncbi:hypothetical protein Q4601_06785 [Shewanella sp. 1_MG-2023]|uniref:DUF7661 family protein n=1 Tax=unclassified Shewanella TaxID=196818 RepID=UPI0026E188B4|nr:MULTISPECIES: hypothetical protein [unclassified Shewanella]MDO6611928.1 hypothetical protein [Shewanella sp. 7_MG-2023]MDO6771783.1 hypothetical protein [Shewanella sp. 2_MG-2023]MDO6794009.1 hypothetical protein [Shewanella sp. 1_MG-2023]